MASNSFTSFYDQQGEVPVHQIDSGSISHIRRRTRLYQGLGLPKIAFRGKKVLEIGPGNGENAEVLLEFQPEKLTLIDGSESAIDILSKKFRSVESKAKVEIIFHDINAEPIKKLFDIVVCEAMLPGQIDPSRALFEVKSLVANDGILVITTQSAISALSELLRRIIGKAIIDNCHGDTESAITQCTEFFIPSFASLSGKTRANRDWVIDVLIHPWENGMHIFELDTAFEVLSKEFNILGSSPEFCRDMGWYKQDLGETSRKTSLVLQAYQNEKLLLIDYRIDETSLMNMDPKENLPIALSRDLDLLSRRVYDLQNTASILNESQVHELEIILDQLVELTSQFSLETSTAIKNYRTHISTILKSFDTDLLGDFHRWWGRGRQYVSFERK
jgi:2-polyprenyl-3-methyl-5-hydroxy-6-metoxy-1,4-benzoquinol methylase